MAANEAHDSTRAGTATPTATPATSRAAAKRKAIRIPTAPSTEERLGILGAVIAAVVSVIAHVLLILVIWSIPEEGHAGPNTQVINIIDPARLKEQLLDQDKDVPEIDLTNPTIGEAIETPSELPDLPDPVPLDAVPPSPRLDPSAGGNEARYPGLGALGGLRGVDGPGGLVGLPGGFGEPGDGPGMGAFSLRTDKAEKEKAIEREGGNKASEAAVASGLEWLALHQAQDGHWSLNKFNTCAREKPYPAGKVTTYNYGKDMALGAVDDDIAGTGLALLPFLGAGQTHKANKEEQKVDYHKGVEAGLTYLIAKQNKTTGMLSRSFYSHGIASIALCEAYGLTSDPKLKGPAQKALDYIVASQHEAGGWRYQPKEAGDLSVTGWQLMALKSGQMSGLKVPQASINAAEKFVASCEAGDTGTYNYLPNGGGGVPSMTACGMLCRQYLGVNPRNPKLNKGVDFLKMSAPASQDLYYLYYATQVMHHMGGEAWAFWNLGPNKNDGIRDVLVEKMDTSAKDGKTPMLRGSWNYAQGHTASGGRLMSTSLALLSLEVYYRHLPLYRGEVLENKKD